MIDDELIEQLKPLVEFRTVCPELAIGLGVPRDPIRIIKQKNILKLVQPATGRDVSDEMKAFTHGFLGSLKKIDGFILKSRSPSCGIRDVKIFSSMESKNLLIKGKGFFGGAICDYFPLLPIVDESQLTSPKIREKFLKVIQNTSR
ncbi:hypothetical protein A2Y85_00155 [candidate division WOR-3 bacterium RBG_13_43_14]|uniref:Uncharacterized protein n=1 Tax=candidate division WOR-3 bacterium RBG_13_43_14 TaxID=1802590 RepID=A0A1F4UDA4_UNCW3|nr:MAG: hypothetical protein A2Y85_00155 [candidate division WOR-3 bacterium RBG_13_43_14]